MSGAVIVLDFPVARQSAVPETTRPAGYCKPLYHPAVRTDGLPTLQFREVASVLGTEYAAVNPLAVMLTEFANGEAQSYLSGWHLDRLRGMGYAVEVRHD